MCAARHRKSRGGGRRRRSRPRPLLRLALSPCSAFARDAGRGGARTGRGGATAVPTVLPRQSSFFAARRASEEVAWNLRLCGSCGPGDSARGPVASVFEVGVSSISALPLFLLGTPPRAGAHAHLGALRLSGPRRGLGSGSLRPLPGCILCLHPKSTRPGLAYAPSAQWHFVKNQPSGSLNRPLVYAGLDCSQPRN